MTPLDPTDEQLAAWLAGDLDDPEDTAVTRAVESDPSVAARADALSAALLRLDVGMTEPPAAGFDARLDAALAGRLGLDLAAPAAAAAAAPPQADPGPAPLPAADQPPRPSPGGRRPRPVWRRGPATRTAHPGQRRIDRLVPGLAVLLLLMVVTTVGIRGFRDGPLPAVQPTADEQTDVLGTDKPATEIPLAAADPSDPSGPDDSDGDSDPASTSTPEDPAIQGAPPPGSGGGSAGSSGDDPGPQVALGGGTSTDGSSGDGSGGTPGLTPGSGAGSAGDGPGTPPPGGADSPDAAEDDGTTALEPDPAADGDGQAAGGDTDGQGGGPDEGTDGQGGGPDGDEDASGGGEEVAAGDQPPPEGQPESQPDDGGAAADEPPTAAGPESAPEGDGPSSPTIADSQASLPDPAAVEQHFGHRPESAAVLGLSGQAAADRAEQHAEEVRQAPPFSSGEVPDRCLGVALQGSSTAVVVAVETVTYDGQPGLAYLVVRGDPLDRADVTIVPSGSCDPLLLRSVPT